MKNKSDRDVFSRIKWIFFIAGLMVGILLGSTAYLFKDSLGEFKLAIKLLNDNDRFQAGPIFPLYFSLEPFTLNLTSDHQTNGYILYIGLTLKLNDVRSRRNIKAFLPEIRSRLLVLFSEQKPSELLTADGKKKLAMITKDAINQLFVDKQQLEVVDVLFDTFILR